MTSQSVVPSASKFDSYTPLWFLKSPCWTTSHFWWIFPCFAGNLHNTSTSLVFWRYLLPMFLGEDDIAAVLKVPGVLGWSWLRKASHFRWISLRDLCSICSSVVARIIFWTIINSWAFFTYLPIISLAFPSQKIIGLDVHGGIKPPVLPFQLVVLSLYKVRSSS